MSKQTFSSTTTTSRSMALEQPRGALGKVSTVFATKLKSFTFLPILKKLPKESRFRSARGKEEESRVSAGCRTDEELYKAEIVYVTDSEEVESGEMEESRFTRFDNSALGPSPTPKTSGVEMTFRSSRPGLVTMEPIDKQPSSISQQRCPTMFESAEVSPELFLNDVSQREEEVLSPASSVEIFSSMASSKESILSEGWEQDRSWSALQMLSPGGSPVSFSRTVSPCSSVRSGTFTPSVLRIKRHTLAPGSSLVEMPLSSGQALCCDSQAPSPCPLSPRGRHRPPPTQLSLLTAILRKGRLPILSSALQRPYSPCWPISPASMSSCMACSVASSLAPVEAPKSCATTPVPNLLSQPARSMPQRFVNSTRSMASKEHKVRTTPSLPLRTPDPLDSTPSEFNNKYSDSTTLPGSPPSEPALRFQSKLGCKGNCKPILSSPLLHSAFYTSRPMSPKSSHVSCCSSENCSSLPDVPCVDFPASVSEHPEPSHRILDSSRQRLKNASEEGKKSLDVKHRQMLCDLSTVPDLKPARESKDVSASVSTEALKESDDSPHFYFKTVKKADLDQVLRASPAFKLSTTSTRPVVGLTRLSDTPDISPASPRLSSRSPTPDRYTLSPSPAFPSRQLSPSPSYSHCSSPSPSLQDKKPYKIKSTYKALAAIPTNTLLLEQQAIDDDVEKKEAILDPSENFAWEDPHSQMCTPAQLRQQSAELYAAIEEALEDTNPTLELNSANSLAVTSAASDTARKSAASPLPRCLGRETKYANFHLQVAGAPERRLTKPGVIRPVAVTRLDDFRDEEHPFQRDQDTPSNRHKFKIASGVSSAVDEVDRGGTWGGESSQGEMIFSEDLRNCALSPTHRSIQMKPTEKYPPPGGVSPQAPSSLKPVQVKMEPPETSI